MGEYDEWNVTKCEQKSEMSGFSGKFSEKERKEKPSGRFGNANKINAEKNAHK